MACWMLLYVHVSVLFKLHLDKTSSWPNSWIYGLKQTHDFYVQLNYLFLFIPLCNIAISLQLMFLIPCIFFSEIILTPSLLFLYVFFQVRPLDQGNKVIILGDINTSHR